MAGRPIRTNNGEARNLARRSRPRRPPAIPLFEDFEQIMTGAGVKGLEAEVIANEKIGPTEGFDRAWMASIASGERHVLASQPAFADAGGPTRARLSWASIHSPSASFWNKARSRPRAVR
jgi:hypothetical protein